MCCAQLMSQLPCKLLLLTAALLAFVDCTGGYVSAVSLNGLDNNANSFNIENEPIACEYPALTLSVRDDVQTLDPLHDPILVRRQATPPRQIGRILDAGMVLFTGESLVSDCGYRAELGLDGLRLVMDTEAGAVVYWSLVSGHHAALAFLQLDEAGELRFYTEQGQALWNSNTVLGKGSTSPYSLKLMNDGNLVVVDAKQRIRWETNTVQKSCKSSELWTDFVSAKQNGEQPVLFDYSYAGYRNSEVGLPDVSLLQLELPIFVVTNYGCGSMSGYCDAAFQTAIDLAVSAGGGIIYFPEGTFYLGEQFKDVSQDEERFMVTGGRIVIKGAGPDKTTLHWVGVDGRADFWNLRFKGEGRTGNKAIVVPYAFTAASSTYVQVDSVQKFEAGDCVVIAQDGDASTAEFWYNGEPFDDDWNAPYVRILSCIEKIVEQDGAIFLVLQEPLPFELQTVQGGPTITVQKTRFIEEVGVEALSMTSEWKTYPEEFQHKSGGITENGWNIVAFEFVRNAWVRDVYFDSVSGAVMTETCMAVTIKNNWVKGKKGHYGFLSRRSRGVLFNENKSTQHHGTSLQSSDINSVILKDIMDVGQSIDFHGKFASRTLMDQVEGGILSGNGGHDSNLPHHAKGLTLWNFQHRGSTEKEKTSFYDFWPQLDLRSSMVEGRTDPTYQTTNLIFEAVIAGLQGDEGVTVDKRDLKLYESLGAAVEPASLFEAQLAFRLSGYTKDPLER
ncbi:hypothetical protein SARC_11301 [Sphaeroforma arctica JP610]|uniref:Bulb-type lectin domain-containing protein n=1 Tax=Sphaeroforma arctica JP610 TaxID=667725 RepID=A0A0L0FHE0_9EUKA|nr:hypothetical protein SARC_11301 [Sphaeroforma arctica JP610]KNC76189.1 hypothetical protein SARC_11301 [Sphaeroforma arctica JP610]|eukprot:XP_014150091.1 hypothetical protein SARC_11301 [Sphaeroforma arctica JP610]